MSLEETVHSPEELRMLVEQSQEGGAIQPQDADLIEGVFEFSEKNAREVMTPRTDVVALADRRDARRSARDRRGERFSRYPVYEDSIDNIVGLVLAKDLIRVLLHPPPGFTLAVDHAARARRARARAKSKRCSPTSSGSRSTWRSCSTSTAARRAS